jgi:hypothetical protein
MIKGGGQRLGQTLEDVGITKKSSSSSIIISIRNVFYEGQQYDSVGFGA